MGWGPEAPDMTAANRAAESGARISEAQWDYYKTHVAPLAEQQSKQMIDIGQKTYDLSAANQKFQTDLAQRYNDRFWGTTAPLQDRLVADNAAFNTEARRDELAGMAMADVSSAFANRRAQDATALRRMGINPLSGRAQALGNQMNIAQAAAVADAANKTRAAARAEGYGRLMDSNSILSGLPGFSSAANNAALGWSGAGVTGGGMGMTGLNAQTGMLNSSATGAATGMQSAAQNFRSNAIESAKSPGFDALMGVAAGGMKLYGQLYGKG